MKLIVLCGKPSVGKLTIAQCVFEQSPVRLFHNHFVVDTLLSLFPFGSDDFINFREEIWLSLLTAAMSAGDTDIVFTIAFDRTVRSSFFVNLNNSCSITGTELIFVEVICDNERIEQRLGQRSRQLYRKLSDVTEYRKLDALRSFERPPTLKNTIILDSSHISPEENADIIVSKLNMALRAR